MKRDIGQELLEGIKAIKNGRGKWFAVEMAADAKEIREKTGFSQSAFAALLGISLRTLQDWEQGRRSPRGPARALLRIAFRHPEALIT